MRIKKILIWVEQDTFLLRWLILLRLGSLVLKITKVWYVNGSLYIKIRLGPPIEGPPDITHLFYNLLQ